LCPSSPEPIFFLIEERFREIPREPNARELAREKRERLERERLREEEAERHRAHANLIAELERRAGAWYRARLLQRYLRAPRRTTGDGQIRGALGEEKVDFLLWAEQFAGQLDPRDSPEPRPAARSLAFRRAGPQRLLIRFLGCDGQPS
jgi:hypothetical protein